MSVCVAASLAAVVCPAPASAAPAAAPPTAAVSTPEPTGALRPVRDRFDSGSLDDWRTVSGAWRAEAGVLRGSGELRRPLCCSSAEELEEARVSVRFKIPASGGDSWGSVSVALNGAADSDRLWLTALPYLASPRIQLIRSTANGEVPIGTTMHATRLTPGSWYRLELDWRHGVAFARIWADGSRRPASPLAGHVFDKVDFHPVAGGVRTHGLASVDADDFSATWLRKHAIRGAADKGSFAPLSQNLVEPPAYDADRLPKPVIDGEPEWKAMYDKAWRILHDGHLRKPQPPSPFVRTYMDEAFDPGLVFQWDTIFMTLYGRYMQPGFDAMGSLDNWYALQAPTGAISRIYHEADGTVKEDWAGGVNAVNPPLFAWAELKSYRMTGDLNRVRRVLPALHAYADWVAVSRWSQNTPHQLYWNNGNGNGMDNLPTQPGQGGDGNGFGHVDMSSQMVLMWRSLATLDSAVGDRARAADSRALADATASRINRWSWNESDGRYYELDRDGRQYPVDSIAGFWTLVSDVAPRPRARRLAAGLRDPDAYWTDMIFPALAKGERQYEPTGRYWQGGSWAPTNFATIEGLKVKGHTDLAQAAAEKYLDGLSEVFAYSGTLWEAYAPERRPGAWINGSSRDGVPVVAEGRSLDPNARYLSPATREGGNTSPGGTANMVKRDFVGWSGLGPIAMLIEDVIGIDVDTPKRSIAWRLTRTDRHGIEDLSLGTLGKVSLVAKARVSVTSPVEICATSSVPRALTLRVTDQAGITRTVRVRANADDQCQTVRLSRADGTIRTMEGKCLDVRYRGAAKGAAVLRRCAGAQKWSQGADGSLRAAAGASRARCLDASGDGTAVTTGVRVSACTGDDTQRWQIRADGTIHHPRSDTCLQPVRSIPRTGTRLGIGECNGTPAQMWTSYLREDTP
ncbi:MGH1-like glycoside hydrolase domain-containing protein [Streptomyces sp. NPDC090026]|uniref:MGH1-like glycoside hydrolase domain-containing protein n=1 Tax=Streptomyces sp. NPDC090026 TaxID=3365923 RepID=UPI003823EB4C